MITARRQQSSFGRVQHHAASFANLGHARSEHSAAALQRNHRITISTAHTAKWKNRVNPLSRSNSLVTRQQPAWNTLSPLLARRPDGAELRFDLLLVRGERGVGGRLRKLQLDGDAPTFLNLAIRLD